SDNTSHLPPLGPTRLLFRVLVSQLAPPLAAKRVERDDNPQADGFLVGPWFHCFTGGGHSDWFPDGHRSYCDWFSRGFDDGDVICGVDGLNGTGMGFTFPTAQLLSLSGFVGPLPPYTRPAARCAGPNWSHLAVGMPRGSGLGTRHNPSCWPAAGLGPFAAAMIACRSKGSGQVDLVPNPCRCLLVYHPFTVYFYDTVVEPTAGAQPLEMTVGDVNFGVGSETASFNRIGYLLVIFCLLPERVFEMLNG
uniref:Uncharacterized protein n=1 Tax=Glossina palpalis gambiensis TaxID=67801 RepID=A0A1B0C627_9MUSC